MSAKSHTEAELESIMYTYLTHSHYTVVLH